MDIASELLRSGTADPVKLAFCDPDALSAAFIDSLDLSLVQDLRRGKDGAIEIKLVDKLRLAEIAGGREGAECGDIIDRLIALLGGEKT